MDQNFSQISPTHPGGMRKLSNSRSGHVKQNVSSYVYRPNTASKVTDKVVRETEQRSSISNMNIVNQLIGEEIATQGQSIEIERLKTTCQSLNQKAQVAEDLRSENQMLRKRISEMESFSDNQK